MSCEAATRPLLVRLRPFLCGMRFTRGIGWVGAVLALAVAVALFTRFSFDDTMRRDEAIYAYGGQQLAAGVPLYRGIFDPKTPVGAGAGGCGGRAGAGAGVRGRPCDPRGVLRRGVPERRRGLLARARAVGLAAGGAAGGDGVRVVPVVRARRRGRAGREDAGDPVRGRRVGAARAPADGSGARWRARWRRWCWQPFAVYPLVAVGGGVRWALAGGACATRWRARRCRSWPSRRVAVGRGRAAGGGGGDVTYPLHGVERVPETLGERIAHIAGEVWSGYGVTGLLLGGGPACWSWRCDGAAACGAAWVLAASLVPLVVFSLHDFQGTADAYPFLPYAAVGVAGACALLAAALARGRGGRGGGRRLRAELRRLLARPLARHRAAARARAGARRSSGCSTPASTSRRSATRFARADGHPRPDALRLPLRGRRGLGLRHDFGGFEGFAAGIRARRPAVVVVDAWTGPLALRTKRWLRTRYRPDCMGDWLLFLAPGVRERAIAAGRPARAPAGTSRAVYADVERGHPLRVDAGVDRPGSRNDAQLSP